MAFKLLGKLSGNNQDEENVEEYEGIEDNKTIANNI